MLVISAFDRLSSQEESANQSTEQTARLEEAPSPSDPTSNIDWVALVNRIQANEESGLEELYTLFSRGIKFLLIRQLGRQDIEDRLHDTFLTVVQAVQRGELREPERLMGFVRTIVRRQIAAYFEKHSVRRREELVIDNLTRIADVQVSPEEKAIVGQNAEIMEQLLRDSSHRDREILTRFYLHEQTQEEICEAMEISETQFRLLKSRAKARFAEEGRRRVAKNNLRSLFLRKNPSS